LAISVSGDRSIALGDPLLRFSYFGTSKRSIPALGHPAEKIEGVVRIYATVEADDWHRRIIA